MATLTGLVSRLRLELGDLPHGFQARSISDGATQHYNLPVELLDEASLRVYTKNGSTVTELGAPGDYTVDARGGAIFLADAPSSGTEVVVEGDHFQTFLTEDLEDFVNTAFGLHTHGEEEVDTTELEMDDLDPVEDYLVVILAHIQALWAMITDAAQEIDVFSPDGVRIPVGQRYQQLMGLIAFWEAKYKELSQALGVGIFRIQMFNLRRVSRTTNRLVPLYRAQEYDVVNRGFAPIYALPGATVTIKGRYLDNATSVKFGGVEAASFTVIDGQTINAIVPAGAVTGAITVTTPGGTITTSAQFRVGQPPPQVATSPPRIYPPIDSGVL